MKKALPSPPSPKKICLVSLYSYPLFNPECKSAFGGSEVRISIIAKELAKRDEFDVNLIVFDHGQPHVEMRDGVRIFGWTGFFGPVMLSNSIDTMTSQLELEADHLTKSILKLFFDLAKEIWKQLLIIFLIKPGNWFRRFMVFGDINGYSVLKSQIRLYDEVGADIYIMPGNHTIAAELVYFCKRRKRHYIFLAGSDMDYDADHKKLADQNNIYGYPRKLLVYAIENASIHIVQNERQRELLKKYYDRSSFVVKNPIDPCLVFPKEEKPTAILWMGKSDHRVKQPDLFLDLVEKYPHYQFIFVLNLTTPETHERCLRRAKQMHNIEVIEYVRFEEIESVFARAKLFINTSVLEGFPNTFLQAAKYSVPILSLQVDPGGMLAKYRCGINCHGDLNRLGVELEKLMSDSNEYDTLSTNCRDYVLRFHAKDVVISQYEDIIRAL